MGALLPSLRTWISPAASSSRSILYFVLRCTPRSCTFVSGKVVLLVFHARYSSQTSTNARGVLVALAACSTHHIGTIANWSAVLRARALVLIGGRVPVARWQAKNSSSSSSSSSRTGGGVLPPLHLVILLK